MTDEKRRTTAKQVEAWETAKPLLDAMYREFRELSKKKPEGAVSKTKISIVNRLLGKCRDALQGEDSLQFLDTMDEDNVPQNSDAVLLLSQYVAALEGFRTRYEESDSLETYWLIKGRK